MPKINNLTLQLNFLKEILVQFEKFMNLSYPKKKKFLWKSISGFVGEKNQNRPSPSKKISSMTFIFLWK